MLDYNPKLKTWLENKPNPDAGINNIQIPGEVTHTIWQHRSHSPTKYELNLVNSLVKAFTDGATSPSDVVKALTAQGMLLESGEKFTEESFKAEMARLGY